MERCRSIRVQTAVLLLIGVAPAEFNWAYNPILAHTPWAFWCVDIARHVVLPAMLCAWGICRGLFTMDDLGLHRRICGRKNPALFAATMIAVSVVVVCMIDPRLQQFSERFYVPHPGRPLFWYSQILPPPGPQTGFIRLLAVIYLSVSAGVIEEFYFRAAARRVFGRGPIQAGLFMILSSLLFCTVHIYGGMQKVVYSFVYGLVFASLFVLTGNLWPIIVAHMLVDFGWLSVG